MKNYSKLIPAVIAVCLLACDSHSSKAKSAPKNEAQSQQKEQTKGIEQAKKRFEQTLNQSTKQTLQSQELTDDNNNTPFAGSIDFFRDFSVADKSHVVIKKKFKRPLPPNIGISLTGMLTGKDAEANFVLTDSNGKTLCQQLLKKDFKFTCSEKIGESSFEFFIVGFKNVERLHIHSLLIIDRDNHADILDADEIEQITDQEYLDFKPGEILIRPVNEKQQRYHFLDNTNLNGSMVVIKSAKSLTESMIMEQIDQNQAIAIGTTCELKKYEKENGLYVYKCPLGNDWFYDENSPKILRITVPETITSMNLVRP